MLSKLITFLIVPRSKSNKSCLPNLQSALHRATVSKSYSLWTPTRSEHNKRAKIGSLRGLFGKFLCLPAAVVGRLSSIKHKNLVLRYSAGFCWTKSRFGGRRKKNHPEKPRCVSATETIARLVSFFFGSASILYLRRNHVFPSGAETSAPSHLSRHLRKPRAIVLSWGRVGFCASLVERMKVTFRQ